MIFLPHIKTWKSVLSWSIIIWILDKVWYLVWECMRECVGLDESGRGQMLAIQLYWNMASLCSRELGPPVNQTLVFKYLHLFYSRSKWVPPTCWKLRKMLSGSAGQDGETIAKKLAQSRPRVLNLNIYIVTNINHEQGKQTWTWSILHWNIR